MTLPFLLETPSSNTVWLMVAAGGATILYAVFRPSGRNKKDPLARSASTSSLSQQRNTERQMESLLVELSEMTRQLSAQLDTRSQKLELLIQEADEKIAALQQATSASPAGSSVHDARMTADDREAWTIRPAPPAAPTIDPRHQEVYTLADQGTTAADIARQLNRPRGEVELILALRPRG